MTEIRFYHLENQRAENALPALLTKALENGHRIIVKTQDKESAKQLSEYLWVFDPATFIPHGTKSEGFEADQPVYLTHEDDNPNNADTLITLDSAESASYENFKLCCKIFDGRNENVLKKMRDDWKALKSSTHTLTYWQQGAKGWEKKASEN